jgi:hypothetical protein
MNLLRPMPRVQQGIGMVVGGLVRKIAVISAVAGLCAASAGCVSDLGAQSTSQSSEQLRYYGGPKYPMWRSQ